MSARRPSPKCRALILEVSRYVDGELPPARRRAVEAHVTSCTCCGTMATRLRTVVAACRAEGHQSPPRDVMQRASARIRALLEDVRTGARNASGRASSSSRAGSSVSAPASRPRRRPR